MANTVPLGIQASVSGAQAVVADIDKMSKAADRMARIDFANASKAGATELKKNIGAARASFGALGATMNSVGGQAGAVINSIAGGFQAGGPVVGAITAATTIVGVAVTQYEKYTERVLKATIRGVEEFKRLQSQFYEGTGFVEQNTIQSKIKRVAESGGSVADIQANLSQLSSQFVAAQSAIEYFRKQAVVESRVGHEFQAAESRARIGNLLGEQKLLIEAITLLRKRMEEANAKTAAQPQGVVIEEVSLP